MSLIAAVIVCSALSGAASDERRAERLPSLAEVEEDEIDLGADDSREWRFIFELQSVGDSGPPARPQNVAHALFGGQLLSLWHGVRGGAVRVHANGLLYGGDASWTFNREDDGNSVIGEVRYRSRLEGRGVAGWRLGLAGAWWTPMVWGSAHGFGGVRWLGVFDDSRLAPLFGVGLRGGLGMQIEVWRFSLRFEAGLGLKTVSVDSMGSVALGFVI